MDDIQALITNYHPSERTLQSLAKVTLVAVIGPSCVGKTTLMKGARVEDPQFHFVLNNTSRQPRSDERSGEDYLFQTREAMEARIRRGEYVQVAPSVFGDLYATAPEGYSTDGIAMLAVLADAIPLFRSLPFKEMRTLFITPPDYATWQLRLNQAHRFTPEQLAKRLEEARRSLQFALHDEDTVFVINDVLEQAQADFIQLALGQPLTPRLEAEQTVARACVADILQRLEQA